MPKIFCYTKEEPNQKCSACGLEGVILLGIKPDFKGRAYEYCMQSYDRKGIVSTMLAKAAMQRGLFQTMESQ